VEHTDLFVNLIEPAYIKPEVALNGFERSLVAVMPMAR
jgi:hypothetical protein